MLMLTMIFYKTFTTFQQLHHKIFTNVMCAIWKILVLAYDILHISLHKRKLVFVLVLGAIQGYGIKLFEKLWFVYICKTFIFMYIQKEKALLVAYCSMVFPMNFFIFSSFHFAWWTLMPFFLYVRVVTF